jgi:hypothetical protein
MTATRCWCPECDRLVKPRTSVRVGKRVRCPACDESFVVEDEDLERDEGGRGDGRKKSKRKKKDAPLGLILGLTLGGMALVVLVILVWYLIATSAVEKGKDSQPPAANPGDFTFPNGGPPPILPPNPGRSGIRPPNMGRPGNMPPNMVPPGNLPPNPGMPGAGPFGGPR